MIAEFCDWLASTPLSQRFQDLQWFVPLVQTIHIFGIAVVAFSIVMLAFRLLGLSGNRQPLSAISEGRMAPVPGGVLIRDGDGNLLGAIGISGDHPDKHEACAGFAVSSAGFVPDGG
jgi:hypothetical protein